VRLQEVVGRRVVAMLILDALEYGELALGPQMHLEHTDAVHDVVVHALTVAAVRFAARLPVAFENGAGVVGECSKLGTGRARDRKTRRREYTRQKPGSPGGDAAHSTPF